MPTSRIDSFLDGDRVDDIAIFLPAGTVSGAEDLLERPYAESAEDGLYIVVNGEQGRSMFEQVTGVDVMSFASNAMGTPGTISRDLTEGECPNAIEGPQEHAVEFVFAFAEAQNEGAGGIYAEGDVIHAYAQCSCGEKYGDKWVVDGDGTDS